MPAHRVRSQDSSPHKRLFWLSTLLAATLLFASGCEEKPKGPPPMAPEVEVITVEPRDVTIYGEWIATLDGYINAQIRPQVSGYLLKRNYNEGTMVRKGEVMFEIDPRPFQAGLDEAKGHLAEVEAQLGKATLDVDRDTPLAQQKAIPQAQLDNDIQNKAAAEAMVLSARAQVEIAKLNLEFTKVRSLVDGIAGIAQGQIGDLVGPTSVLTTVSQVEPIKAYFAISEQEYMTVAQKISAVTEGRRERSEAPIFDLILADGTVYPHKGWVVLTDRQVDPKTGTFRLAGAFANPGSILRPGQFGRVRAVLRVEKDALTVPQRAVVETQGTYMVAVVSADNKASIRPVKPGDVVGQEWIIAAGLKPGERVVVEGVQKIAMLRERGLDTVNPKPFRPATGSK